MFVCFFYAIGLEGDKKKNSVAVHDKVEGIVSHGNSGRRIPENLRHSEEDDLVKEEQLQRSWVNMSAAPEGWWSWLRDCKVSNVLFHINICAALGLQLSCCHCPLLSSAFRKALLHKMA